MVDNAFEGINSTIVAYGQTGSGKTFTIFGPPKDGTIGYFDADEGLIPRVCKELFARVHDSRKANEGLEGNKRTTFKVDVSMMEIYLEKVYDLLAARNPLAITGSVTTGFRVEGLKAETVNSYVAVESLLKQGNRTRTTVCTALNDLSTRAHTLFHLKLTQSTGDNAKVSKIILVDLAGSERIRDSQVEGEHVRKRVILITHC